MRKFYQVLVLLAGLAAFVGSPLLAESPNKQPVPEECPAFGVTLPVEWHRNRDGDTPEVQLPGGSLVWAVRLEDCWCFELRRGTEVERAVGRQALRYADQVLSECDDLRWHIPIDRDMNLKGANIFKLLTFDRLPGYLYVGPKQTLNRMLVDKGLASTTKGGRLGE